MAIEWINTTEMVPMQKDETPVLAWYRQCDICDAPAGPTLAVYYHETERWADVNGHWRKCTSSFTPTHWVAIEAPREK